MDNNDSMKPQQTGGLKIMTVFIVVLALHVLVIGGFTVYHLMSGGSTDADLATSDKTHTKSLKNADGTAITDSTSSDTSAGEKNTPTTTSPTDVTTAPATPATPTPESAAPAVTTATTATPTPAPVPTPAPTPVTATTTMPASMPFTLTPNSTPLTPSTQVTSQKALTPMSPIAPELAPPAEPAPATAAPVAPVASGPVHMPPAVASAPVHEHEQTYTVKITDSYKKIAKAHHITVAQLKEANHIKSDTLHTGQKLVIPSGKTLVATSASVTSLEAAPVASDSTAPVTASLAAAPATAETTTSHSRVYTIVKGDTLTKIAHKFKTTPTAIMAENSITDPAKLTIGKKLKIPSQEARSAKNSAPPSPTQPSQVQTKENTATGQLANFVP